MFNFINYNFNIKYKVQIQEYQSIDTIKEVNIYIYNPFIKIF